jgi:hypothetical protein
LNKGFKAHGELSYILCALEIGTTIKFMYFSDQEQEEPCEGRPSRTVLWEGKGEIPLSDPIMRHPMKSTAQRYTDIEIIENLLLL